MGKPEYLDSNPALASNWHVIISGQLSSSPGNEWVRLDDL